MQIDLISKIRSGLEGAIRGYRHSQKRRKLEGYLSSGIQPSYRPWIKHDENVIAGFQVKLPVFDKPAWYAHIHVARPDQIVIEDAIRLLDEVCPQKYGPEMRHIVSFWRRERLLNLLLEYFHKNGSLPLGPTKLSTELNWAEFSGVASWKVENGKVTICERSKVGVPLVLNFPSIGSEYQRQHNLNEI